MRKVTNREIDQKLGEMGAFLKKVEKIIQQTVPDRRRAPRKQLHANMEYKIKSAEGWSKVQSFQGGMLLNISKYGMLFHTRHKVPQLGEIELHIPTGEHKEPLKAMTRIVRMTTLQDGIVSVGVEVTKVLR